MLFIPIIGAVLLSVAGNLGAAAPTVNYGSLVTPELNKLYESLKQAVFTEKPSNMARASNTALYKSDSLFYNNYQLTGKLDILEEPNFVDLRDRVVRSALKHFATTLEGEDNVEPVQAVKDACNTLAQSLKANKIRPKPKEFSPSYIIYMMQDDDLKKLIDLNTFCSIMEGANWGQE